MASRPLSQVPPPILFPLYCYPFGHFPASRSGLLEVIPPVPLSFYRVPSQLHLAGRFLMDQFRETPPLRAGLIELPRCDFGLSSRGALRQGTVAPPFHPHEISCVDSSPRIAAMHQFGSSPFSNSLFSPPLINRILLLSLLLVFPPQQLLSSTLLSHCFYLPVNRELSRMHHCRVRPPFSLPFEPGWVAFSALRIFFAPPFLSPDFLSLSRRALQLPDAFALFSFFSLWVIFLVFLILPTFPLSWIFPPLSPPH